jgi:hypothetical protein
LDGLISPVLIHIKHAFVPADVMQVVEKSALSGALLREATTISAWSWIEP